MKKTAEHKAVDLLVRFHLGRRRPPRLKHPARQSDYNATRAWGWRENILGFGIGEKHVGGERQAGVKCLTLFVRRKMPVHRLLESERIPASLHLESIGEPIVTDLVVLAGPPRAHATSTDTIRPVQPGAGVGHIHGTGGTLGLLVRQGGADPVLALSCSHVLARSGNDAAAGNAIEQPWDGGGEVVGNLTDTFTRLSDSGTFDEDMALATLTATALPQMVDTGIVVTSTADVNDFGGVVTRNGVTTGKQSGTTSAFETAWHAVPFPFVPGGVTFTGLVAYSAANGEGDSGAAVLDANNAVVGLHVAGNPEAGISLFEPIGPIMSRYNLALFTG